jgi:hypothetical protein
MKTRQRKTLAVLALLGALFAIGFWTSCVSVVTPPKDPSDPVTVRLLSSGRHAGLLLPCPDGRVVEYGYGHWDWYALLKNRWWHAPGTILWPGQGTLGRRYLDADDLGPSGENHGLGQLSSLAVSKERTDRLLAKLDSEFAAGGTPRHNELDDMAFVKHPDPFWFPHTCHDQVAEWLRDLGCDVSPAPIRKGLRVIDEEP